MPANLHDWHWSFAIFPCRFYLDDKETRIWWKWYQWRYSPTKESGHGIWYEYRLPESPELIGDRYVFLED
jgi:hypothetical protein